eukprot:1887450-Pyramimonas_sp.AAC.1
MRRRHLVSRGLGQNRAPQKQEALRPPNAWDAQRCARPPGARENIQRTRRALGYLPRNDSDHIP